ncbi:hypothetical protein PG997_011731 [Apiospora hydei]|uniref:Uncharacterized protein n=1 Tax=Apiospora hydei TaxID=1337664 RepID=A0ABR1V4J0_9PEZI
MGRELNNAMNKGFEDEKVHPGATEDESTARDNLEASQIMKGYRENKSSQGKVHGGVYSVSEIAYATAFVERYRQLWKDLIIRIIANADICVATPVAARQLANLDEQSFKPRIVWSDDVGRTTEAAGLAPFTFFPDAQLRILSGDLESEIVTPSVDGARKPEDSKVHFINRYALQLGTSILKRMERGGAPVSRLQVVHTDASSGA